MLSWATTFTFLFAYGIINGATLTLPAQRRLDIDIHTPAGADKYGQVIVTHDGPFGAIKGVVSQYTGPISVFALAGSVPLEPIEKAQ